MRFESDDETEISDRQPLLKMSKTQDDPFYQIRDEVKIQVDQLKVRLQRLQELVRIEDASSKQEFTELRRGLVKDVRNADKKVRGLKEAVEVVEKNRHKFSHIRDGELQSRKAFVDQIQIAINDIKVGMEAPAVRKKIESDAQNTQQLQQSNVELSSNPSAVANNGRRPNSINNNNNSNNNPYNPMKSQIESENNDFIRDNKSQQTLMIKKQDENLGLLEKGVDSLGVLAKGINQELNEQNVLLDHLGNEVDDSASRLDTVMGSLNKMLNQKDGCQMYTIVALVVIAIILLLLVIYV